MGEDQILDFELIMMGEMNSCGASKSSQKIAESDFEVEVIFPLHIRGIFFYMNLLALSMWLKLLTSYWFPGCQGDGGDES